MAKQQVKLVTVEVYFSESPVVGLGAGHTMLSTSLRMRESERGRIHELGKRPHQVPWGT